MRRYAILAIATALLAVYAVRLDPSELTRRAAHFPAGYAVAIVALNLLPGLLKLARWRGLLVRGADKTPLARAYLLVNASFFLGLVTPGTAGELSRGLQAREDSGEAVGTVGFEKIVDLVILVLLAALSGIVHFTSGVASWAVTGGLALAVALGYGLVLRYDGLLTRPLKAVLQRLLAANHVTSLQTAWWEVHGLLRRPRVILVASLVSLALWLVPLIQMQLIYAGLGLADVPLKTVAATFFGPYLVGVLSLLPVGLGTFDVSMLELSRLLDGAVAAGAGPLFFRVFITLPLILFGYGCQLALVRLEGQEARA